MINNIKEHIHKHKRTYSIGIILFISLLARIVHSIEDSSIWWDSAVYIGMGKYIATGGTIGMWEILRPPLFPLFYALLYIFHLPLIVWGKVVVILASVGCIWITYILAESIKKGSGVFASIFLSIVPVFFSFSSVPITDIISVFFVLLAILLYKKKRYLLVGLCIGVAFLLRFPQGLALVSLGCIVIYEAYERSLLIWLKNVLATGMWIIVGFALLALPFFISNHFLYGSALRPLILGSAVLDGHSELYDLGTWYYVTALLKTAPFLIFSILAPFLFLKKNLSLSSESKANLRTILITAFIYCVYFFWQSHKELRYSIAFVPYLSILSGVVFIILFEKILRSKIFIVILSAILVIFLYQSFPYLLWGRQPDAYTPVYEQYKTLKGSYISTTPLPVALGDVRIVEFFSSIPGFTDALSRRGNTLDGITLNMCDLYCSTENNDGKSCLTSVMDAVNKTSFVKKYEATINECTYMIFKK